MDFPGIKPSQIRTSTGAGQVSIFADTLTKGATLIGAPGAAPSAPAGSGGGDSAIDEDRVARQIYTVFFGDAGDHLGNAVQRTFEGPLTHFHLDSAIIGIESRYSDELARMRELHSDDELRAITRAGAEAAFEEIKRGDIVGFLPQFEDNVMAAMNKTSREILQERRDNAPLPPLAGPQRPLEWNEENRTSAPQSSLELDGERDSWQPGDVTVPSGSPDSGLPDDFMQIGPSMPERNFGGIDEHRAAMQSPATQPAPARPFLSGTFMADAAREVYDNVFERAEQTAREAIERALGNSSFVTGENSLRDAIERHGWPVELMLHALWPQFAPGPTDGAPDALPVPSTATANVLRSANPHAASMIVTRIGDNLDNLPRLYRAALREALANGDQSDPDILRAMKLLDGVSESGAAAEPAAEVTAETPPALAPLTPEEESLVQRYVQAQTFTRATFDRVRALNPQMRVDEVVRELAMHMQGFGTGKLQLYPAPAESARPIGQTTVHDLSENPSLRESTLARLHEIADFDFNDPDPDERARDAATIADQIIGSLDTGNVRAIALTDDAGNPVGVATYSHIENPADPTAPRIIYLNDVISFVPGQGIGLTLLQEVFDRGEGIMELLALSPELNDYYSRMGGQVVPCESFAGYSCLRFQWVDRPARYER